MERHLLTDFGMPGAIVHFVERFYGKGYEDILYQSIKRSPTMLLKNRQKNFWKANFEFVEQII